MSPMNAARGRRGFSSVCAVSRSTDRIAQYRAAARRAAARDAAEILNSHRPQRPGHARPTYLRPAGEYKHPVQSGNWIYTGPWFYRSDGGEDRVFGPFKTSVLRQWVKESARGSLTVSKSRNGPFLDPDRFPDLAPTKRQLREAQNRAAKAKRDAAMRAERQRKKFRLTHMLHKTGRSSVGAPGREGGGSRRRRSPVRDFPLPLTAHQDDQERAQRFGGGTGAFGAGHSGNSPAAVRLRALASLQGRSKMSWDSNAALRYAGRRRLL
jgi:hypothetical protein